LAKSLIIMNLNIQDSSCVKTLSKESTLKAV